MAYTAPTTRVTGTLITAAIWNADIVDNIAHLAAMKIGGTALSALTAISAARGAVGTYTGNGATTKAITGVGFQPDFVLIWQQKTGTTGAPVIAPAAWRSSSDTNAMLFRYAALGGGYDPAYVAGHITALGADGFTAGDGSGSGTANYMNVNLEVYSYIALKF